MPVDVVATIKRTATLENLPAMLETVTACAREQGVNPKHVADIELSLEEVLVNIIRHAYQDRGGEVEVHCGVDRRRRFIVTIVDWGRPFDFSAVAAPDITADIAHRAIGGLGIFLIKKLMDDVGYRREKGRNILTLTLDPAAKAQSNTTRNRKGPT